jgi:hypothetical protein
MTEGIESKRRRVVKRKEVLSIGIEDGVPVVNTTPEEVVEYDQEISYDEFVRNGVSPLVIPTELGDAVYSFAGNCIDCSNKRPPEVRPVFVHAYGVKADDRVGIQRAAFRRDGRSASALCQNCYADWLNRQPKQETTYKVL